MRTLRVRCVVTVSSCVLAAACVRAAAEGGDPKGAHNVAPASTLPRGDGCAARFAADRGIAALPSVIFADDFEGGDYGTKWDSARDDAGAVLALVDLSAEDARLGRKTLRVTATLGKNTGGGVTKWFASADTLFFRFYVKFDPGCDYVHHFCTLRANKGLAGGDRWSGFGGAGLKPAGDERFSTALEPWGDWGRLPPPGRWNFYSYWHEMAKSPDGKFWGNAFRPAAQPDIRRGAWICAEFMLVHNTPGKPDGEQAFWIDGELRGHWRGINWRTSPALWANAFTLESYVTDSWTKNPVNVVCFDNVVIAKEYIGPAGNDPRRILDGAVAAWHLADLSDGAGADSALAAEGAVDVGVPLGEAERAESLRRGGDGRAARFSGGRLSAGQGAAGELNLASDALTVCLRLRDPSGRFDCPLFSKYGGHERLVYNFFSTRIDGDTVLGFELGTEGGMTQVTAPLSMIGPSLWHDLIARYDGAKVQLFADGVWLDEGFPIGRLRQGNREPCLIGGQSRDGAVESGFGGLVDHAALWDRALTDAEVEALSGGGAAVSAARARILGAPRPLQYFRPHNKFNVGDTFPLYHDGVFRFYYLLDRGHHSAKNGLGAHQWAQAVSADLVRWEHQPLAIPITDKREASICTGSVFVNDGVFHGFYATRAADRSEALSLATSPDGVRFTKTLPNPFLSPGPRYTRDFRDPHVFRDGRTGLFHLLVSSVLRDGGRGCLAHFTSRDLQAWKEEEPFHVEGPGGALECSEHFGWRGWYYLLFNGSYRMSRAPLGPWEKPPFDRFDGPLFAVPKTAAYKDDRRIVTAWLADRGWGGRAVFREVVQNADGTLGTRFLPEMAPAAGEPVSLSSSAGGDAAPIASRTARAGAPAVLDEMPRNLLVTLRAAPGAGVAAYGLRFRLAADGSCRELRLLPAARGVRIAGGPAIGAVDGLDRPLRIEAVLWGDILDVCIDGRRTLIGIAPDLPGRGLGFFAEGGEVSFDDIAVRPLSGPEPR